MVEDDAFMKWEGLGRNRFRAGIKRLKRDMLKEKCL